MLVYEIYDTIENKYYVGITKRTLKARKVEHLRENKCNQHFHKILQSRPDTFTWNVVAENIDDIVELTELEKQQIQYRDSFKNGYNATLGGDWHNVPKNKNAYWYGKHWSEEEKKMLSKRRKGKGKGNFNPMAFEKYRKKVSEAKKGKPNPRRRME